MSPGSNLRSMADAINDEYLSAVLHEAATAFEAGDRSPLLVAVMALAFDLTVEAAYPPGGTR